MRAHNAYLTEQAQFLTVVEPRKFFFFETDDDMAAAEKPQEFQRDFFKWHPLCLLAKSKLPDDLFTKIGGILEIILPLEIPYGIVYSKSLEVALPRYDASAALRAIFVAVFSKSFDFQLQDAILKNLDALFSYHISKYNFSMLIYPELAYNSARAATREMLRFDHYFGRPVKLDLRKSQLTDTHFKFRLFLLEKYLQALVQPNQGVSAEALSFVKRMGVDFLIILFAAEHCGLMPASDKTAFANLLVRYSSLALFFSYDELPSPYHREVEDHYRDIRDSTQQRIFHKSPSLFWFATDRGADFWDHKIFKFVYEYAENPEAVINVFIDLCNFAKKAGKAQIYLWTLYFFNKIFNRDQDSLKYQGTQPTIEKYLKESGDSIIKAMSTSNFKDPTEYLNQLFRGQEKSVGYWLLTNINEEWFLEAFRFTHKEQRVIDVFKLVDLALPLIRKFKTEDQEGLIKKLFSKEMISTIFGAENFFHSGNMENLFDFDNVKVCLYFLDTVDLSDTFRGQFLSIKKYKDKLFSFNNLSDAAGIALIVALCLKKSTRALIKDTNEEGIHVEPHEETASQLMSCILEYMGNIPTDTVPPEKTLKDLLTIYRLTNGLKVTIYADFLKELLKKRFLEQKEKFQKQYEYFFIFLCTDVNDESLLRALRADILQDIYDKGLGQLRDELVKIFKSKPRTLEHVLHSGSREQIAWWRLGLTGASATAGLSDSSALIGTRGGADHHPSAPPAEDDTMVATGASVAAGLSASSAVIGGGGLGLFSGQPGGVPLADSSHVTLDLNFLPPALASMVLAMAELARLKEENKALMQKNRLLEGRVAELEREMKGPKESIDLLLGDF